MKLTPDQLAELARLAHATADEEIDCAELLDRIAEFLHASPERRADEARLRQVAQHLQVCPECREEFLALIRAEGLDPSDVMKA